MDMKSKLNMNVVNAPMSGIRKISDSVAQMKDIIRFDLGEPDFDTPKHIKEAAIKAIHDGFNHYTVAPGIMELRKAISEKLRKDNGMEYDPADRDLRYNRRCGGDLLRACSPSSTRGMR